MKLILAILILSFSSFTWAAVEIDANGNTVSTSANGISFGEVYNSNFSRGSWEAGGSLNMGYSTFSGVEFVATPKAQYFVSDNFSFGPVVTIENRKDYKTLGLGASGSFYFWSYENWVSYVSQNISVTQTNFSTSGVADDSVSDISGMSTVGLNYFFHSQMAAGINFNLSYLLTSNQEPQENTYSDLSGAFFVYF